MEQAAFAWETRTYENAMVTISENVAIVSDIGHGNELYMTYTTFTTFSVKIYRTI